MGRSIFWAFLSFQVHPNVDDKYDHMNVGYTMYVTSEDAVMANNSTVTYVIAVLKADYSAVV